MNSVYPPPDGSIFVNVNVYSYSLFAVISVGPVNVFPIDVDSVPFTNTVIFSFVNSNLLDAFVRYLSFTLILITPASKSLLAIDHTGDTTSTICPSLSPSPVVGSSIPIVIVLAMLLFPVVSVTVPSAKANFTIPL